MAIPYPPDEMHWSREYNGKFCSRCGKRTEMCPHPYILSRIMDPAHAVRIRARYEIGKAFNPDHDTTDYFKERP